MVKMVNVALRAFYHSFKKMGERLARTLYEEGTQMAGKHSKSVLSHYASEKWKSF